MSSYMKNRGYNAVDGDYIEGLSTFVTASGEDVTVAVKNGSYKGSSIANRLWDMNFLEKYLNNQTGPIIVFGWAANISDSLSMFDKLFYLGLTQTELAYRFKHNEREHDYGKKLAERQRTQTTHKEWLGAARHKRIPIIKGTTSPERIEEVLSEVMIKQ